MFWASAVQGARLYATRGFCALQAHARGGEWPRLYSAVAHVDMDLGYIGRALYRVRWHTLVCQNIMPCAAVP